MNIFYNDKTDLLYIRLDDKKQDVINRRVSEDIVLDIGENEKVIGIEIIDASKHVNLETLLPIKYEVSKRTAQVYWLQADNIAYMLWANTLALRDNAPFGLNVIYTQTVI